MTNETEDKVVITEAVQKELVADYDAATVSHEVSEEEVQSGDFDLFKGL